MRGLSIAVWLLALGDGVAACSTDNGCEEAFQQVVKDTKTVCAEPGYQETSFCTVCVNSGHYSTTGPPDCRCKLLAFDQPYCTYPGKEERLAQVRGSIEWANQSCPTFTFAPDDGGTGGAAGSGGGDGTGGTAGDADGGAAGG